MLDCARAWRALSGIARIRCSLDISGRRNPDFADVRCWASAYTGIDWIGEPEPGISVVLMHAIARRYQRSPPHLATDACVLQELGAVALRDYRSRAHAGGEFACAVDAGTWHGHIIETSNRQVVPSFAHVP